MRLSLSLVALAALAACAPAPAPARVGEASRQCFMPSQASGFQTVGEEALLLRVRVNEVWRLDFEGACPNVQYNLGRVGLQPRYGGRVCKGPEAEVVFSDASVPRRCLIQRARRLTQAEIEALPPGDRP